MSKYYCYQLWNYSEPGVSELKFENDKEAIDYWLHLYEEHKINACFSITRLFEVDGVFHEEFLGMIKRAKNGVSFIKSHAL